MAIASNVPIAPVNERRLRDYNYIANVLGPAAATNTNTAALDLIQPQWQSGQVAPVSGPTGPYAVTEHFWVNVVVGAATGTANNKNVNVYLQTTGALSNGTVDTANFANVSGLAVPILTVADANGAGLSATGINIQLPPTTTKRFIRAQAQLEANGGTANASTITLQLLF